MAFGNHVDARAQNKKNGQISGYNVTTVIVDFTCKYWVLSTCTCNSIYNCFDSLKCIELGCTCIQSLHIGQTK